jgi:hypothetical protein
MQMTYVTCQLVSHRAIATQAWMRLQTPVGFAVYKMTLVYVFLRILRLFPVTIIPPLFHTHLCISDATLLNC